MTTKTQSRRALSLALALALAVGVFGVGCAGPGLHIKHEDPGAPRLQVLVDDRPRGALTYGDSISIDTSVGAHAISLVPDDRSTTASVWKEQRFSVYVDENVEICVHPPAPDESNDD